jgi:hypothetical protein
MLKQEDTKQSSTGFIWLHSLSEQAVKLPCHAREGLEALFTIISMDDEKEIVKNLKIDGYTLAEQIQEASPYLVLIPKYQNTIVLSASSQFQGLCLL